MSSVSQMQVLLAIGGIATGRGHGPTSRQNAVSPTPVFAGDLCIQRNVEVLLDGSPGNAKQDGLRDYHGRWADRQNSVAETGRPRVHTAAALQFRH